MIAMDLTPAPMGMMLLFILEQDRAAGDDATRGRATLWCRDFTGDRFGRMVEDAKAEAGHKA